MATISVTQVLAYAEIGGDPAAPLAIATQVLAYAEIGPPLRVDVTQLLVYVEIDSEPHRDGGGTGAGSGASRSSASAGATASAAAGAAMAGMATVNGAPAPAAAVAAAVAVAAAQVAVGAFTVELTDTAGLPVQLQNRCTLTPTSYSATITGGPDQATVQVVATQDAIWDVLNWLGYRLAIRNPQGNLVWAGYIEQLAVHTGAVAIGLDLAPMANRIAVAWTSDDSDGAPSRGATTWLDDTESQARYGIKALMLSLADSSQDQAAAYAATALAALASPQPTLSIEAGVPHTATLTAVGYWRTLDWFYYTNATGRLLNDVRPTASAILGYSRTATTIGFKDKKIHDLAALLAGLSTAQQYNISGAGEAANNGVVQLTGSPRTDSPLTYVASTISFDPADDILDSAKGFGIFSVNDMLQVSGASQAANNAIRFIKTKKAEDGQLEAAPYPIVTEAAGATVTLTVGHSAETDRATNFSREPAGATVTLASVGSKLAQAFVLDTAAGWTVRQALIQAQRYGAPADLRLSIYSNVTGAPGVQLCTATIAAADVPSADMDWVQVAFATGAALAVATTYWLVVEINGGATAAADYYAIGLDPDLTYTDGALLVWTGAAWTSRTPAADLPFQLWSVAETTDQIAAMLAANPHYPAVDVGAASGVETRQYRTGDLTIRAEVERLLAIGDDNARTLVATVGADRIPTISAAPAPDDRILLRRDGRIVDALRQQWETGVLPVGRWVRVVDIPESVAALASVARLYIIAAEYQVDSDTLRLTPRGAESPWESTP